LPCLVSVLKLTYQEPVQRLLSIATARFYSWAPTAGFREATIAGARSTLRHAASTELRDAFTVAARSRLEAEGPTIALYEATLADRKKRSSSPCSATANTHTATPRVLWPLFLLLAAGNDTSHRAPM